MLLSGSRLRAIRRLTKLGVYFASDKQEALVRGDKSGAVLHRHFSDGLQTMGLHFGVRPDETPAMVRLQARYVQEAWESFIDLSQSDQHRTKAQALVMITHSFVILGLTSAAQLYALRLCKVIEDSKLQFFPECGRPAELSEQVREEVSVLSQAIYLENYIYLALGASPPTKTKTIEREFRLELQVRNIQCSLSL